MKKMSIFLNKWEELFCVAFLRRSHHVSLASLECGVLLFLDFWYDRSALHLTLAVRLQ